MSIMDVGVYFIICIRICVSLYLCDSFKVLLLFPPMQEKLKEFEAILERVRAERLEKRKKERKAKRKAEAVALKKAEEEKLCEWGKSYYIITLCILYSHLYPFTLYLHCHPHITLCFVSSLF